MSTKTCSVPARLPRATHRSRGDTHFVRGGTTIATTTTAADGTYSFTSDANGNPLTPATYKVTETQPAGYLQGTNTVGTVNGASDGALIPVDMIGSVVLTSGQNSINNNFGELKPVTISGNVYEDKLVPAPLPRATHQFRERHLL